MAKPTGLQFTLHLAGADGLDLAVTAFEHHEHLSMPFRLDVTFASREGDLSPLDWLDRNASLRIHQDGRELRRINGIVAAFHRGDRGHRRTHYQVSIRPALWRLSLRRNSRIFQHVTPQRIIQTLCEECGIQELAFSLTREWQEREFCVQYREDALSFIERLAAEEGAVYFHEMEGDLHRVVFCDDPQQLQRLGARPYQARAGGRASERHVRKLVQVSQVKPSSATLEDLTFKNPGYAQRHRYDAPDLATHGQLDHYEHYDYPGRFKRDASGIPFARIRLEHLRNEAYLAKAESDLPELCPGSAFTLQGHDLSELDRDWQVVEVTHIGTQPQAVEEDAVGITDADRSGLADATRYHNRVTLIPGDRAWRPTPNPKPRVEGPQIATVVGPEGEEIFVDEFGRVKLRFHWDRDTTPDERASAWVRVAQGWAGGGYGMVALPRIGHSVVVDWLEADPDQPLITGRVYDASNPLPYPLPQHKTRTTIRTQTHKGSGANELRFEDEKDREEVYLHAQRDHNTVIENDETHSIGNNRSKSVAVDQREQIGQDKTSSVGRDHSESVGQDVRKDVGRDVYYTVGQSQKDRYGKDVLQQIGNTLKQDIHADRLVNVGRNVNERVQGQYVLEVTDSITNNARHHTLMGFERFEIRGPGGKITLDASGITLEAPNVRIKGNLSSGGSGSASVPTLAGAANDALPLCEECEKLNRPES